MKKKDDDVNSIEEIKRYIREINELHLEEEAYLVRELGGFGVGSGFELGQAQDGVLRFISQMTEIVGDCDDGGEGVIFRHSAEIFRVVRI